jgi:hypothetical protein
MLQQHVTSLAGPQLDESRGLQLANDFGPRHSTILKPTVRFCQTPGLALDVQDCLPKGQESFPPALDDIAGAYTDLIAQPTARRQRTGRKSLRLTAYVRPFGRRRNPTGDRSV